MKDRNVYEQIRVNAVQAKEGITHLTQVTSQRGGNRHYVMPSGQKLVSVTSVLKVFPKPALVNWASKVTRDTMTEFLLEHRGKEITTGLIADADAVAKGSHNRKRDEAGAVGSQCHAIISKWLLGELPEIPSELTKTMKGFQKWYTDEKLTLIDSEACLYSDRYAGSMDALFHRENGHMLLVDFKTSNNIYLEHKVQAVAYTSAIEAYTTTPIDIMIVKLDRSGEEYETHEILLDEKAYLRDIWRTAREFHSALENLS